MLKKKSYYFFLFGLVFYLYMDTLIGDDVVTLFWDINNTDQIGGHNTTMLGSPIIIDTEQGRAGEFDGLGDGLIVDANPVAGAEAFTIEVMFKPYVQLIPQYRTAVYSYAGVQRKTAAYRAPTNR